MSPLALNVWLVLEHSGDIIRIIGSISGLKALPVGTESEDMSAILSTKYPTFMGVQY